MSCFGFVLHRERAAGHAAEMIRWLEERGHEVRLPTADSVLVDRPELGSPESEMAVGADVVVSLGGDGTMLRAVAMAADEDVPVLGVNLGQLGYLTEVEPSGMRMAIKRFLSGAYSLEDRMRLEVEVWRAGHEVERLRALNETVVEKTEPGHTVRLEVDLDGRPFTSYVADGVVLATPTGSTAYSFSVRGPIVDPQHRAILLAPVAPHMLFDRTLVLRPDCDVSLTVAGDRNAGVSVDGRGGAPLLPGDRVVCRAGSSPARFVTFGTSNFHSVLREKFGLSDR